MSIDPAFIRHFIITFDLKSYIKKLFLFLFAILLSQFLVFYFFMDKTLTSHIDRVNTIINNEGYDIELLSNLLGGDIVGVINNDNTISVYERNDRGFFRLSNNSLPTTFKYTNLTKDLDYVFKYENIRVIINTDNYINLLFYITIFNIICGFMFFSVFFFKHLKLDLANKAMEQTYYKIQLENKLQRDLSESLHHELSGPVAIAISLIKNLYHNMYPCGQSEDGICEIFTKGTEYDPICGMDCRFQNFKRTYDSVALEYYSKLLLQFDRIKAVVIQSSATKHIKYNNGNSHLRELLENVINGTNIYRLSNLTFKIDDPEPLTKWAIGYTMSNGDFLQVMQPHVNNALEAKATHIEFSVKIHEDENKADIYIVDNGRGVRDRTDKIITPDKYDEVFKYGYTNKNINGDPIVMTKIDRFLKVFNVLGIVKELEIPRGSGLSFSKRLCQGAGGDVVLAATSENGTVFKLTIPIKPKK